MGYIFDALNKQDDQTPEDQPPRVPTSDGPPLQGGTQGDNTGLAELMSLSQADHAEDADALQRADLQLTIETDATNDINATNASNATRTTVVDAQEATPQPAQIEIAQTFAFDDEPVADRDSATQDLDADDPMQLFDKPKAGGGWWSRLLGRHLRSKIDDRLVAMTSPASAMSEEYRSIRTSILARHDNERHLVHTITSATPQEGKTITCVNLGLSFAELRNRKTIIIECDLRLPTFGKLLDCDNARPGLIDFLRGEAKVSDIIQKVGSSPLHIIAAGGRVSDEAVQLLSSPRMSQLIQGLRAKYDHVLIDTPPVLQLADAGILGSQSEEVLVVARMRRTPRPLVEQAINTLTSYNAQVNGIVATDNPRSRGRGYGYGYKYGYRYGYAYGYTPDRKGRKHKKRRAA